MSWPLLLPPAMAAAYLLGSLNFAVLLFALAGRPDPRLRGSGNAGTTNVYRQAGALWAAAILLLDLARAAGIALAGLQLLPLPLVPWLGLGLLLGNRWPLWHGFKGGKGVATYLGFTALLAPAAAGLAALAWVCVFALLRRPYLASFAMVAVLAGGTLQRCGTSPAALAGMLLTVCLIVWAHRGNLRLRQTAGKATGSPGG
ncbi:MAG: glycerol-3-phosphate acyltransferase [Deltaproteobacteria bacterium]|nr:glycerol-3-phosphate acyltransferase [Deltaproteobacteria bacterium]